MHQGGQPKTLDVIKITLFHSLEKTKTEYGPFVIIVQRVAMDHPNLHQQVLQLDIFNKEKHTESKLFYH